MATPPRHPPFHFQTSPPTPHPLAEKPNIQITQPPPLPPSLQITTPEQRQPLPPALQTTRPEIRRQQQQQRQQQQIPQQQAQRTQPPAPAPVTGAQIQNYKPYSPPLNNEDQSPAQAAPAPIPPPLPSSRPSLGDPPRAPTSTPRTETATSTTTTKTHHPAALTPAFPPSIRPYSPSSLSSVYSLDELEGEKEDGYRDGGREGALKAARHLKPLPLQTQTPSTHPPRQTHSINQSDRVPPLSTSRRASPAAKKVEITTAQHSPSISPVRSETASIHHNTTPPPPPFTVELFSNTRCPPICAPTPKPKPKPKPTFTLLSPSAAKARKRDAEALERLVGGDYDAEGGKKREEEEGEGGYVSFWKQGWFRWTVVGVGWGVLCLVVGGAVGLVMR